MTDVPMRRRRLRHTSCAWRASPPSQPRSSRSLLVVPAAPTRRRRRNARRIEHGAASRRRRAPRSSRGVPTCATSTTNDRPGSHPTRPRLTSSSSSPATIVRWRAPSIPATAAARRSRSPTRSSPGSSICRTARVGCKDTNASERFGRRRHLQRRPAQRSSAASPKPLASRRSGPKSVDGTPTRHLKATKLDRHPRRSTSASVGAST